MFLVINKEKVYAYIVSVLTIVTLFVMSSVINTNFRDSKETSSNIESNNINSDIDIEADSKMNLNMKNDFNYSIYNNK